MPKEQKDLFENYRFVIAVGYGEDTLEEEARKAGLVPYIIRFELPFDAMKAILLDFSTMSSISDVLLVDTLGASEKKFAPFMKMMESSGTFFGRIWFYKSLLNRYPLTIISRCGVFTNPDMDDVIKVYLEKQDAPMEYLRDMKRLKHYNNDVALRMLQAKESFISFLVGLQGATAKDYHILAVNEDKSEEFMYLLYEWLMDSPIFTQKELTYCKKLRDFKFQKLLGNLGGDKSIERYILPYIIAYQISK